MVRRAVEVAAVPRCLAGAEGAVPDRLEAVVPMSQEGPEILAAALPGPRPIVGTLQHICDRMGWSKRGREAKGGRMGILTLDTRRTQHRDQLIHSIVHTERRNQ